MRDERKITYEFVEFIPKDREEGVLYISIPFATAVHNCFCGCGIKVVTPLSPVFWKLIFDGETASLSPSVGNWDFPCRSHYFVRRNIVVWEEDMTQEEIDWGRNRDRHLRERHFDSAPEAVSKSLKKAHKKAGKAKSPKL
jgi:Family of unknown function (DUF6527)